MLCPVGSHCLASQFAISTQGQASDRGDALIQTLARVRSIAHVNSLYTTPAPGKNVTAVGAHSDLIAGKVLDFYYA